jgi:hypothetical protein
MEQKDSKISREKGLLRSAIIYAINNREELNYLEKLCKRNHFFYDYGKDKNGIVNYFLDCYLNNLEKKRNNFQAKYSSMWRTAWYVMHPNDRNL